MKPKKLIKSTEWIYQFWAWQLLVWSLYRYFFKFTESIDEFIVKPLVFVLPVILYVFKKERQSLISIGITGKQLLKNVGIGLGIGLAFVLGGIGAHFFKYGTVFPDLTGVAKTYGLPLLFLLSLATAFSEELLTRGFLFSRLWKITKKLYWSALIITLLYLAFHVPILVTSLKFQGMTLIIYFWMNFILSYANCLLYAYTGSLVSPILVHLFWNLTVAVFL